MNAHPLSARLAVCSWSLQPTSPQELIAAVKATGVHRVQLDLDPLRESPATWGDTQALLTEAGIDVVSGMFRTVGEDYTTMETIRVTGGIAPDATWEQNTANIAATVPIAKRLALDRPTISVNFDPANMVLYDKGDPIDALRTLGPWIGQVHIKDGIRTKVSGDWGEEVVVGRGDVDWKAFFTTLAEVGFTGDLCIEREAGTTRVADIAAARQLVEGIPA